MSNTFRKSAFEYSTKKCGGGGNRRQREYAVICFLGTSLDIQGQSIYVSVISTPQWTVQAKTKKTVLFK